jgi:hypothetical protein
MDNRIHWTLQVETVQLYRIPTQIVDCKPIKRTVIRWTPGNRSKGGLKGPKGPNPAATDDEKSIDTMQGAVIPNFFHSAVHHNTIYEGVSKSFRTESIKKYTLTTMNTR